MVALLLNQARNWMPGGEEFAEAARRAFGDKSQREVASATGVSQGTIHNMVMGLVPSRRMVTQIADRLALTAERRRELFAAAGYRDPDSDWDPDAAFMAGFRELAAEFGEDVSISAENLQLAREGPEGVAAALAAIRQRFESRQSDPSSKEPSE